MGLLQIDDSGTTAMAEARSPLALNEMFVMRAELFDLQNTRR